MKYSESNKPLVCMQTQSRCYRNTREFKPLGVLWHSTGANNTDIKRYVQPSDNDPKKDELIKLLGKNKYGNDWNHVEVSAGLNCWIGTLADGTVATVQSMPWNYRPWGCGSGSKGSCNDTHIQFEIAEDSLNDSTYFNKVYQEACELTAYLCKMYNLDPKGTIKYNGVTVPVILCHADSCKLGLGSNHGDVLHWFKKHGKTMDDVRNDVAKLIGNTQNATTPNTPKDPVVTPTTNINLKLGDEVRLTSDAVYYNGASIPGWVIKSKLYVRDIQGDNIVISTLKSGAVTGRVNKKYLTKDGKPVTSTTTENKPTPSAPTTSAQSFSVGDKVKLVSGAKFASGQSIASWVFDSVLYVREINGDKIVISTLKSGAITGTVYKKDLTAIKDSVSTQAPKPSTEEKKETASFKIGDEVKLTADAKFASGQSIASWVFKEKLYVRAINGNNITISTLKSGAITGTVNAKYLLPFNSKNNVVSTTPANVGFKLGDKVKLVSGAKFASGQSIASWVFDSVLYVREINGDNIIISTLKSGAITGTVNKKYLTKI